MTAVDFLDNLLKPLRTKATPKQEMGVGGTAVYGGYIVTAEKSPYLTGRTKYQTYSNLLADVSIVASGTRYFLNLVAKTAWKVEPAEDGGAKADEYAGHIEDMMSDMLTPWPRIIRRAALYKFYGFGFHEWTAKVRDDGLVGMLDISNRPQLTIEQWDLDTNGRVQGIVQRSPQTHKLIYVPRAKMVYLVDDSLTDSPDGLGLLRHVVEPARRLARYEQLEGFGFEGDLRGIPIGRAPFASLAQQAESGQISTQQRDLATQPLKDFVSNHVKSPALGMLLDSITYHSQDAAASPSSVNQWDMDILKGGATSQGDVHTAIGRLNEEIARCLGVEALLLGSKSTGSMALSRDKSNNFALIVDSTLVDMAAALEQDFVDVVFQLNGWDPKLKPKLKTDAIAYRDIEQVTGALLQMSQAGAVLAPDDPAIDEVRDLMGLSRPTHLMDAVDASLSPKGPPGAKPGAPGVPGAKPANPLAPAAKPGQNQKPAPAAKPAAPAKKTPPPEEIDTTGA